MLERILERPNLLRAWKRVKANGGAAGIDEVSIAQFPDYLRAHWTEIRPSVLEGRYRPSAVRRKDIPKPGGGSRMLGIPTVTDRLIQQAIGQVITPLFDPDFSDYSHGFRPGRKATDAVRHILRGIVQGYRYAVDVDLKKFFDRVNHDVLMSRVSRKISDKRVLSLIGRYLRSGISEDGKVRPTRCGVPQGGPLSPLLANIVLDDLDKELEGRGHYFARYADDFVILVKSRRAGERVLSSISRFLQSILKLEISEQKSRVVKAERCTFLGFTFPRKTIRWTDVSYAKFKRELKRFTKRSWGVSMDYRMYRLRTYIQGWMGYYHISEYYRPLPDLDQWLRRRVRMCYWKQWRRPRRRITQLLKLRVPKSDAIFAGISRKSYWRLATAPGMQIGLSNDWLGSQGLLSVRDLWVAYHYPGGKPKGK